jgi:hypothetical protein
MTEEEHYRETWKRRKLWRQLDNSLGYPLYFVVLIPFLYFLYRKHFPTPFVIFGSLWFGAAMIAGFIHGHLRCPRCERRFSVAPPRSMFGISYRPYCANCGLPEGVGPGTTIDPKWKPDTEV